MAAAGETIPVVLITIDHIELGNLVQEYRLHDAEDEPGHEEFL